MSEDIFISGLNVEDIKSKQHLHYVYGVCFPGSACYIQSFSFAQVMLLVVRPDTVA